MTSCERAKDERELVDYWLDEPAEDREDAPASGRPGIEEHLFECEPCSRRLRELVALGAGIRRLVAEGAVETVVTPGLLARAAEAGLRIREYRVAPGQSVRCTVTPEDDLLVSRLAGRFAGVSRLDLLAEVEGQWTRRTEDVPFDPGAEELLIAQAMPAVRALGDVRVRLRLLSLEGGGERLVGEYTFDHRAHAP